MAKPGHCEICKIFYHDLTGHNKRMHHNGRETKKQIEKKKKITKPPKKEASKDKYYETLERKIEDLTNENEVLRKIVQDLHLLVTGKLPKDATYTIKPPITLVYMSELKEVLANRRR